MTDYSVGVNSGADSEATVNGVTFKVAAPRNSGTGGYNTFLAIQDNDGTEQGFNSDGTPTDENQIGDSKTFAIKLSSMPVETRIIDGVPTQVYVIRLDLNESNGGTSPNLDLNQFKIYTGGYLSDDGTIIDTIAELGDTTLRYDLDAGGDNTLHLYDGSSGSGTDDYEIVIPVSVLGDANVSTDYVYIFAQFGTAGTIYAADGGFEEFNLQNAAAVSGVKFNDENANGVRDDGEEGIGGVTIFIDTNANGTLDVGERSTVTADDGTYTFGGLFAGTYRIDEVVPTGQIQSTGDFETIVIPTNFTAGQIYTIDPIGNFTPDPEIAIQKTITSVVGGVVNDTATTADDAVDGATDQINYQIVITNTGNVALTAVQVTDLLEENGYAIGSPTESITANSVLEVGESWTYTLSYVVQQSDIDNNGGTALPGVGLITNSASVTASYTFPDGTTTEVSDGPSVVNTPIVYEPEIELVKATTSGDRTDVDGDGRDSAGDTQLYTYTVTNTGNVTLFNAAVTDDNGTPGDTSDDFTVALTSGLTDEDGDGDADDLAVGAVASGTATYTFTQDDIDAGSYANIGTATADDPNGDEVADDDDETVTLEQEPSFTVEKAVSFDGVTFDDADDPNGPQASIMQAPTFLITIANTGNVTLTGFTIEDVNYTFDTVNGTTIDLGGAVLSGDTDNDGDLDVGETWTLLYDQPLDVGYHKNTVTVEFDEAGPISDDAYYYVLVNEGPGVRTPGFWQGPNNGLKFWDGIADNQPHQGDTFPDGDPEVDGNQDLLYAVDSNGDGVIDGADKAGLLIGDYDMDGIRDPGEDVLFISLSDAQKVVDASNKKGNDGTYTIGRDAVATWLNYLSGNNIDPTDATAANIANAPRVYIDEAIDWLQEYASFENDASLDFARFQFDAAPKKWQTSTADGGKTGQEIHNALGNYNEDGTINGEYYAGDADSDAFAFALSDALASKLYVSPLDQADQDVSQMMYANTLVSV